MLFRSDLGTGNARWIVKGITFGFGVLILVCCRLRTDGSGGVRSGVRLAAEWSLILLGMLLLSERTWKHHAVTLVLPFLVLTTVATTAVSAWLRMGCWFVLGSVAILMFGQSVLAEHLQDLALVYGTYTAVFVLLTAGIVAVLISERK